MLFTEKYFGLSGKTAVVIGGGGVLAGTMAEGLARAGANVCILDLNLDAARRKAKQISDAGIDTLAVEVDASDRGSLENALQHICDKFRQIDILINAPGINSSTPFLEIEEVEWDRIMAVNLKSMFMSCQVFGEKMIENADGGSIINVSSASSGPPLSRVFTYSISKAGVNNLTQYLAREWASHKVRVNAIAPGFFPAEQNRKILTEERINDIFRHTPMNRFGDPDELIGAVIWLASGKASSFVTGAVVRVDGGFSAMTI